MEGRVEKEEEENAARRRRAGGDDNNDEGKRLGDCDTRRCLRVAVREPNIRGLFTQQTPLNLRLRGFGRNGGLDEAKAEAGENGAWQGEMKTLLVVLSLLYAWCRHSKNRGL